MSKGEPTTAEYLAAMTVGALAAAGTIAAVVAILEGATS